MFSFLFNRKKSLFFAVVVFSNFIAGSCLLADKSQILTFKRLFQLEESQDGQDLYRVFQPEESDFLDAIDNQALNDMESIYNSNPHVLNFEWRSADFILTPLVLAITMGNSPAILKLKELGLSFDNKINGRYPILYVDSIEDREKRKEVIKLLLDKSSIKDEVCDSLISNAFKQGLTSLIDDIIEVAVDEQNINKIFLCDGFEYTFLRIAILKNDSKLVEKLIQMGADINQKVKEGKYKSKEQSYMQIFQFENLYEDLNACKDMVDLLEEKGLSKDMSIEFEKLLEWFGTFDSYSCKCSTDIDCSCSNDSALKKENCLKIILNLIQKNEEVLNFKADSKEEESSLSTSIEETYINTLLKEAVMLKNKNLVTLLLDKDASIEETFGNHFNLLDYALLTDEGIDNEFHVDFLNFLLEKGAPVSPHCFNRLQNSDIDASFAQRCCKKYEKQEEVELSAIDIDYKKINGFDDNHLLYQLFDLIEDAYSDNEALKNIIGQLPDEDCLNKVLFSQQTEITGGGYQTIYKVQTPLICVIRKDNIDAVQVLIKSGANVNCIVKASEESSDRLSSPLEESIVVGNQEIIDCLLSNGAIANENMISSAVSYGLSEEIVGKLKKSIPLTIKKSSRRFLCFDSPSKKRVKRSPPPLSTDYLFSPPYTPCSSPVKRIKPN
ncbi:hypothetical protein JKY79_01760 [Candidatus Babeliales bacterium]|nr:hypothetical protein [Candidatus Babeliales bacterium]